MKMTLYPEKNLVEPGGLVTVPVRLLDASDVADTNFAVSYDPSVIKPAGAPAKGSLLAVC